MSIVGNAGKNGSGIAELMLKDIFHNMKIFAIKVCIKGRLASLFETGGKGGI